MLALVAQVLLQTQYLSNFMLYSMLRGEVQNNAWQEKQEEGKIKKSEEAKKEGNNK